jgi:hypothetical protein
MVENYHFPPQVESLIKPKVTNFGEDIGYTLHRWPNHHRALNAMIRLSEREGADPPKGSPLPIECWLERAARYARDDTVVRGLYAMWLIKKSRNVEAAEQLALMNRYADESPMTHYNIALLYSEMKRFPDSLEHLRKAESLGFTATEVLRQRLREAGSPVPADTKAMGPADSASAQGVPASSGN